jgi:hypothetical protein
MLVTESLETALDAGMQDVCQSPVGHLSLLSRRRIWASFGPRYTRPTAADTALPLRKRTHLAVCAARFVLPYWEELLPEDQHPHDLLDQVMLYSQGRAGEDTIIRGLNDLWTEKDNLLHRGFDCCTFVAAAAARAAAMALVDARFASPRVDAIRDDREVDPLHQDAAFYASVVCAGGYPWDPGVSAAARKAFWEWYLLDAAPAAWALTLPHRLSVRDPSPA